MLPEIRLLIQLQDLDQTLKKLRIARQDLVAQTSAADENAEAMKLQLEERSAESKSFLGAMDSRELNLKGIEQKIANLELQLNTVKTNREYSALQHEIAGFKADKSRIEDEILQMMDRIERDKTELEALSRAAADAAAEAAERKKSIEAGIRDADARMERLTAERRELTQKVPENFLLPYERLLRKGDGRAMAACRNFVCDACRMSLTANTVNLLMAGDKLIYCHSCGRILYLAEDEDVHGGIGAGRKQF